MKLASALVAAAAFYGGAHLVGESEGSAVAAAPAVPAGTFRLVADGGRTCTVVRGAPAGGGAFELRPAAGCEALMPGLAGARVWREEADGTVTFGAGETDPLVAFAVADGDGYESFRPAAPILSLTAERAVPE